MLLVTGSDGLLGSWLCAKYPKDVIGFTHQELNVTDSTQLYETILDVEPDAVINCAGITKNQLTSVDNMVNVNALVPHRIAKLCDLVGAKLVQISTDCIFSGNRGKYHEEDVSDAADAYGQTKYRGEVVYNPHLTVRTSFVGWPDPKSRGLLAWLHSQQGSTVQGYMNVQWNGLCVSTLADVLVELAYSRHHGVMHVFSETISKGYLLALANYILQFDVEIELVQEPKLDRTLTSIRNDCYIVKPSLVEQLQEMREWETKYRAYLSSCQ